MTEAHGAHAAESAPLQAQTALHVTDADTARAVGSGDLPVLGTPRLIALAEQATVAAAAALLAEGQTTVGTRIRFDHVYPTPVGGTVTVTADLAHRDDRLLRFTVAAHDADGRLVGEGEITRVIVNAERFMAKL
ncbi:thioesterase family protein [Catenulispora rubra]|uniref:thioesterase family protein n=1 Tax=Catenulispora rubra TaxID=280293 RepID=UPI001892085C|nr:hotdog domain-containing protein [Catenulispora rubra]